MSAATSTTAPKYADVTLYDMVDLALKALFFPIALMRTFILALFAERTRDRTWKRIFAECQVGYFINNLRVNQLQVAFGESIQNCKAWSKTHGTPLRFEEVDEGGRLIWVGSENADHVLIHCPPGGYVLPVTGCSLTYLQYLQKELRKKGKEVAIVVLVYSTMPTKTFPVPLKQLVQTIQRVQQAGFPPSKMSILGESAGGNLIAQLLSHLLHPHPRVPCLQLSTPLRSAYMMSPWIRLLDVNNNMRIHDNTDYVVTNTLNYWGNLLLKDMPHDERPYADPNDAPQHWWCNAENAVDRVLLTAGKSECLKEECIIFSDEFEKHHGRFTLILEPNAPHADTMAGFFAGETNHGQMVSYVVDWLAAGM